MNADLIIIDEASSMKKDALRCIDDLLRDLVKQQCVNNHIFDSLLFKQMIPFGGKTILLGGDFRQTLPVV